VIEVEDAAGNVGSASFEHVVPPPPPPPPPPPAPVPPPTPPPGPTPPGGPTAGGAGSPAAPGAALTIVLAPGLGQLAGVSTVGPPAPKVAPDRRAPRWQLRLGARTGTLRRRKVVLRLRSDELATYTLHIAGGRTGKVIVGRNQARTVKMWAGHNLLRRVAAARGRDVLVRIRVSAVDAHRNSSRPRWVRFWLR
jgi:hypothetical protein